MSSHREPQALLTIPPVLTDVMHHLVYSRDKGVEVRASENKPALLVEHYVCSTKAQLTVRLSYP